MTNKVIEIDSRKVRDRPRVRGQERLHAFRVAEAEHAADDAVLRAAASAPTVELLRLQVAELARECAALRWDREHAADARERQRLASRRIRALRSLASAVVELHRIEGGAPSPRIIEKLLADLQNVVEDSVVELFDAGTAERMLTAVRGRLGPAFAEGCLVTTGVTAT